MGQQNDYIDGRCKSTSSPFTPAQSLGAWVPFSRRGPILAHDPCFCFNNIGAEGTQKILALFLAHFPLENVAKPCLDPPPPRKKRPAQQ